MLLFLAAWLVAWAFGEVSVAREIVSGRAKEGALFLTAWLALWTIGGAFALYAWLWTLAGREIILLQPDVLSIRRDLLGVGPTREYDLTQVRRLRVAPLAADGFAWGNTTRWWGVGGGAIAFDYGSKTFRFGAGIDEAEGRQIIDELKSRHPFEGETA